MFKKIIQAVISSLEKFSSTYESRLAELKEVHSKTLLDELEKKASEHSLRITELESSLNQKHSANIEKLTKDHELFISLVREEHTQQNDGLSQVTFLRKFKKSKSFRILFYLIVI